jgi:hypothetical protein
MDHQLQDSDLRSSVLTLRFARAFSNVFSPPSVSAAAGLAVAWVEYPFWPGLAWAAVYGFLISLVPLALVVYLLKTGRVSDLHLRKRGERHTPYLVGVSSAVVALIVAGAFGASQLLLSLIVCNIIGLAALGFINVYWLISSHTASIAMTILFVSFVFGASVGIALLPLIGLTFFARLTLRRHTVPQLVAGLVVGAAPVLVLAHLGYLR